MISRVLNDAAKGTSQFEAGAGLSGGLVGREWVEFPNTLVPNSVG